MLKGWIVMDPLFMDRFLLNGFPRWSLPAGEFLRAATGANKEKAPTRGRLKETGRMGAQWAGGAPQFASLALVPSRVSFCCSDRAISDRITWGRLVHPQVGPVLVSLHHRSAGNLENRVEEMRSRNPASPSLRPRLP